MSSAVKTTKTYTYRSSGGGNADVSIEYSADLSALSRLEVGNLLHTIILKNTNHKTLNYKTHNSNKNRQNYITLK
jgi:hypothetical protein